MNNTAKKDLFLKYIKEHYRRCEDGRYINLDEINRIQNFCEYHHLHLSMVEIVKSQLQEIVQTCDSHYPSVIHNSNQTVIELLCVYVIADAGTHKIMKKIIAFDYQDFCGKYFEAMTKEKVKDEQKKENRLKKRRLFIDMDGTIVVWNGDASFEEVAAPGYFSNIAPMNNSLMAVKYLVTEMSDKYEIFILSSVFEDGHSIRDKNIWLDRYLPEIDAEHRIFVPYSRTKRDYVREVTGAIYDSDVLVDDFTKNLAAWHGVGIKILNGINGNKGTWNGYVISHNMAPETMARAIDALACA